MASHAVQSRRHRSDEGLTLIRDVLGRGVTIEAAARERGEASKRRIDWWGSFFRRCLKALAVLLGFACKDAYKKRPAPATAATKRRCACRVPA
jgi:hypothetical protein